MLEFRAVALSVCDQNVVRCMEFCSTDERPQSDTVVGGKQSWLSLEWVGARTLVARHASSPAARTASRRLTNLIARSPLRVSQNMTQLQRETAAACGTFTERCGGELVCWGRRHALSPGADALCGWRSNFRV